MNLLHKLHRLLLLMLLVGSTGWLATPALRAQAQSGFTSPSPGSSVNGAVPLIGTAVIEPFQRFELYFKQEPNSDDAYIYFGGDTNQVINGQLGVWQTGDLPSGVYTVRMRVVKTDGNYSEHFIPNLSVNQQPPTPTPTETPEESPTPTGPTETPIPISTPTSVPQPTPAVVQVEQPDLDEPSSASAPAPTPTPATIALGGDGSSGGTTELQPLTADESAAEESPAGTNAEPVVLPAETNSFTREVGAALALDRLREQFITGMRFSAVILIVVFGIFAGKRLLEWVLSRAT